MEIYRVPFLMENWARMAESLLHFLKLSRYSVDGMALKPNRRHNLPWFLQQAHSFHQTNPYKSRSPSPEHCYRICSRECIRIVVTVVSCDVTRKRYINSHIDGSRFGINNGPTATHRWRIKSPGGIIPSEYLLAPYLTPRRQDLTSQIQLHEPSFEKGGFSDVYRGIWTDSRGVQRIVRYRWNLSMYLSGLNPLQVAVKALRPFGGDVNDAELIKRVCSMGI